MILIMNSKREIVAIIRMGDSNVYYHLKPLAMSSNVSLVHIIRPRPPGSILLNDNFRYHEIQSKSKLVQFLKILMHSIRLARRPEVMAIVSFFAFPYGFFALLAGWWTGKPVHIGFVGSDWYRDCESWYGRFLNFFLRNAQLFTVTGNLMKKEMVSQNYPENIIFHLPHAIDISSFENIPPDKRKYDCIFVGNLIFRKRVDLIIAAIDQVKRNYPDIKVCIVGDGPLREELENDVRGRGLNQNIFFAGHQVKPNSFFSNAKINLIASDMEGFPFSIVEGIASGTVPISTNVGTISDIIEHEKNGLIITPGNSDALSENILKLIENPDLYMKLRQEVLSIRESFSFENTSILWEEWLKRMNNQK